ncbi:MAG: fibronectin type III domain-containing protein, partial [Phycisphaerales bacterium]|nr:fibronectin type III domain-containing protein [Phycisphaerales bacterium]
MSLSSRAVAYLQAQYRVILHQMRQDAWQEQAGPMLAMLRRIPRGAIAQTRAAVRQISEYGLSGYEGDGVGGSVRVNPRRKRGRNICDAMHFDALEPRMLLSGQTLYWQGGSGTWDLTSTDHWNTAADGSGAYVAFANGDDAVIAGGNDFTITVSSDITTLYGNLILDIGSSTATIDGLNLVGDLTWHSGEITLSNTQLSGNIVLDGGNNTLSLNNSTITNEDSGSGLHWTSGNIALVDSSQLINSGSGGLWLDGGSNILSLDDSSITNAYYYGNGIHWTSGDIVLVDSSQLINSGSSGLWLDGGGNTLSLDNSTIANESYSGDGIHWTSGDIELTDGSQMIHSGYGGLWLGGDNNTLSLDDSTITNEDYYGAGIHWIGGTIELANGSQLLNSVSGGISLDGGTKPLTLDDSSLTNNDCGYPLSWTSGDIVLTNGSQLFSSGNGGISLDGGSNTLSLNNSTITNDYYYGNGIHWISGNIVLMNSSQLINSGNGDLYLDGGSNTLSLNDSTIANEASGNGIHWTGGDIVLVNNSQLINTVSGGLWLDGGGNTLSLNNSTITNVDYYGYGMHWTSGNIVLANGSQINSSPGYYFYLDGKSNSLTLDDSTLDNTGLVQWDSGSILLRNGAQIVSAQIVNDNPSTNPFEIPSGQTVTLDVAAGCVIQGNITNNGTLNWTGSDLSQLENITNNGSIVNGTPTPAVDLSVQANAVSSSVITLQWNALPAEDGHTGFVVLISSDNGQTFSSYATVNGDATSLQVTGLQPVSPYEFQVRAVDADGTVITSAGTPVVWTYDGLAAPTDVQVVKDDNGGFVLTWTDNSDGEASYQVEIKCPSSDNFSLWYTLPANLTSCSVSGDWNGVEVTYRVRAVVTGESAYSAPYTYAFPAIPSSDEGEVYDLQVTVNDPVVNSLGAVVSGSVTLTWKYFGNDEHPTFHLYMNSPAADTGWFEELGYYGYMINNANVDGDTYSVTVYDLFLTWPGGIQIYMDAEGIEGIGTPSEIIPVQLNFMLDPPTNLTITCLSENEGGDYEYLLEWDPSSSPNVTYQLFSTSINIEGNHWLASFEGGDTYCIIYSPSEIDYSSYGLMVRAVTPDQSQVSDMSNIVSSMPVIPALPAPYPLTAKAISDHSVGLEWDNTSNSESGYEIQRSYVNSTDDADWETIASLGKDVTSYVDSGLVAGETYYYRAKALGSGTSLDSSWTSSVSVTMPATSCITCKGNPLGLPDGQVLGGQQWQNAGVTPTGYNNSTPTAGNDWLKAEQLHNGTIVFSAQDGFHIYFGYSGSYYGIGGNPYTLRRQTIFFNGSNQDLLVLGGGTGIQLLFTPFDSNGNGGQFVGMIDAAGHITSVDAVDANGNPLTVTQDLGDGNWQTIAYAYNSSGDVVSRSVTQNGNLTSTFFTAYTYYGANSVNGLPGSLELIADTTDTGDIEYTYMRYYTEGDGSQGKLKYLVTGSSYERLLAYANANGTSVDLLADSVVAQYADNYYEYDNQGRVTKLVAQGNGCSGCQGGFGTTTYSYAANKTVSTNVYNATTYNTWAYRQTEADNSQNLRIITYSNFMGQVMLQITQDLASGQQWMEYYRYDASGRQIMHADPSAVLGYDEALPDLVGAGYGGVASNYQYLADHDGLIEWTDYNSLGYQVDTAVMQGDGGTSGTVKHYQTLTTYSSNYANGETYYYISAQTWFSEDVASSPSIYSTGAQTTYYSYGWISGTNQVQWEVVTLPTVNSVENGPGTADVWRTYYDSFGRLVWTMDPDGYVNYTQYDPVTGAVTLSITDKTLSPAEQSLFNSLGWTNYHSSGLNLETTYEVDSQGRTVKITSPDGTITRIVYDDAHQAIYSFVEASESLDANGDGTITPLGPVTMSRGNMLYTMANGNFAMYDEYLTFSGDFSVVNNEIQLPTWCEGGGGNDALLDLTTNGFTLQTLSRWLYNTALQLVESDSYAAIDNATYLSTAANSPYSGTAGANFYATSYYYDVSGQQARTVNADGAIAVTTYDALGRQLATYVGTNDGNWEDFLRAVSANPLAIPAGTDMTLVTLYQYDNDGIGDSNLTQITEFPGGSEAPRITQYLYDWQDRMIASKVGVQTNETGNTSFINYNVLNNIGQVTASYTFAADNIPLANFADSGALVTYASQLRSYSTTLYDAQGRAYQSATYSVDPTTGTISSDAIVSNVWYDHCGNVVKSQTSGGPVSKTSYDGAGRVVASYLTDGGGDAAAGTANTWADAQNVIGDIVLEQVEYLYDANSNVILVTDRQRFDDATGTGELGDPSSTTQPKARVSYSLSYYDVGGRLIANVEVGTNGGVTTNANGGLNLITDTNADGIPDVLQGSVPAR